MFVDVVSAPEAKPAAGAAHAGGWPARGVAPPPRQRAHRERGEDAERDRRSAATVESSARSANTPATTPGIPHASMISESRTSGCGRRPSVPSVIRLTIRPSRISSPTACSGSVAANSSGAETSAKPKPVADWSAAPASTATPAAISRASTPWVSDREAQGRVRRWSAATRA